MSDLEAFGPLVFIGVGIVVVLKLMTMSESDKVRPTPQVLAPARPRLTARDRVEQRMSELMDEFPALAPAAIAQLFHDELMNEKCTDEGLFKWATEATAARVMRTRVVTEARARRATEDSSE